MDLLSLLVTSGAITQADVSVIQHEAGGQAATSEGLEQALLRRGISAEAILKAKGDYYRTPTRLIDKPVSFEILRYVPEESARFYRLAPIGVEDGALEIGITNPDNLEARDALNFISSKIGMPYKLFLILESDFNKLLEAYKGLSGEVGQALSEIETADVAQERAGKKDNDALTSLEQSDIVAETEESAMAEGAPVTKIVATIVRHAVEANASDIHIEPMPDRTRVRFRVDGVLSTNITVPAKIHNAVATRIKVLSNMRLDEKRKPQDGRFSAHVDKQKVDFRVSTFPTYWGEKVEMRILGVQAKKWQLDNIGLSARNLKLLQGAIKRPYGLILISGPTGSGKSTTLYSLLSQVDTDRKNVLSLEDPVEYTIAGVNQSQVRPEIGYTFANGLRTTLRQDPNIIMVGEIRDKETADLAMQAALTGHLVLSTIHTNNAVGIVPRLLDMGIDPYLIPPTLVLGVAQRLVQTLCEGAGDPFPVEGSLKEMIDNQFADVPPEYRKDIPAIEQLYRAHPTADCPSGTHGRTAVFEMFEMTPKLERAILEHKSQDDFYNIVRQDGMLTFKEDAIIKSSQGLVPFEQVNALGMEFELDTDAAAEAAAETTAAPAEAPADAAQPAPVAEPPQDLEV